MSITVETTAAFDAVILRQRYEDACVAFFEAREAFDTTWETASDERRRIMLDAEWTARDAARAARAKVTA